MCYYVRIREISNLKDMLSNLHRCRGRHGIYGHYACGKVHTMKNKITVAVTIIIMLAVLLTVGGMSAFKNDDQKLSFTDMVTVTGGKVISQDGSPVHFDPVGETCSFTITASGPDGILSDVKIYIGDPLTAITSDPLYSTTGANFNTNTDDLSVSDRNIYISTKAFVKEGANIEDGQYGIAYTFTLHVAGKSASSIILPFVVAILLIALSIYLVFTLNKASEKDYDEMQIRQRGKAALNAFIITIVTAMGFALFAKVTNDFPLTVYETGMIIALTGAVAFGIICDINDAFVGFKENRFKYAVLFWIIAITGGFGSLANSAKKNHTNDIYVTGIIAAIFFAMFALELTIRCIVDKKYAGREDADEES